MQFPSVMTLFLSCLLSLSAPARAQDLDSARSGPYLGVNGGVGFPLYDVESEDLGLDPSEPNPAVNEEISPGVNVRAGWRLLSFLALEAQYEWMGGFEVTTAGNTIADITSHVVTANVRLIAPLPGTLQPYALLGIGAGAYLGSDIGDAWNVAGRGGVGVDFYVTPHVVFNLETSVVAAGEKILGERFPYVSATAGLQYRF